jgi:peptide/nickel transport system substrate-binding protein
LANKWERYGEPMLPVVDVTGPSKISIGKDAAFDVLVSFKDAPYPAADMDQVVFLLYDAEGTMVDKGQAKMVADGQYQLTLTAAMTSKLKEGSAQMEVIAVSKVVTVPVFSLVTFVAAP